MRERLFVLRVGEAGVPLRVVSLRGGDLFEDDTDASGQLFFPLRVADDDELRIQSTSERWELDWAVKIANAHLDPDVPLELDVGAFLQRASPPSPPLETAAESARCRDGDDIQCLLRRQRELSAARRDGDCNLALDLAGRLAEDLPEFAATHSAAAELAALHVECALWEEAQGDLYARSELLLRRAVALAAGVDGAGWCDPQRSRILAAAHGELRETAAAAGAARRARERCPERSGPLEWEFFFRVGLGQADRAAEVAASVDGELGAFLRAWSAHAAGDCPLDLASWIPPAESIGATPCTVLPQAFCLRARNAWILRCGDDEQLAAFAGSIRAGLEQLDDPALRSQLVEDLAELEYAGQDLEAAAREFRNLRDRATGETRRGLWSCRLGSTLLRAGRYAEALDAFEDASASWATSRLDVSPVASSLDRLVVENNVLVLASALRGEVDASRLRSVQADLDDLLKSRGADDPALRPWRLAVENNLLELRTRAESERAEVSDAREVMERLQLMESDYRRHVESVVAGATPSDGASGEILSACSALAFASEVPGAQE